MSQINTFNSGNNHGNEVGFYKPNNQKNVDLDIDLKLELTKTKAELESANELIDELRESYIRVKRQLDMYIKKGYKL